MLVEAAVREEKLSVALAVREQSTIVTVVTERLAADPVKQQQEVLDTVVAEVAVQQQEPDPYHKVVREAEEME